MDKIRLTKIFRFEMAHALWNYDGKCKNIHGHSYKLVVTVIGEPKKDPGHPKDGMVMDFGDLKRIVNEYIVDKHDHYVTVNANSPHGEIEFEKMGFELVNRTAYQPTSENMVLDFVKILQEKLPSNVKLYSLRLYETADSYAEWNVEDNS